MTTLPRWEDLPEKTVHIVKDDDRSTGLCGEPYVYHPSGPVRLCEQCRLLALR